MHLQSSSALHRCNGVCGAAHGFGETEGVLNHEAEGLGVGPRGTQEIYSLWPTIGMKDR